MADQLIKPVEADLSLNKDELRAVWAALVAMVQDIHAPQDLLSEDEWQAGEDLLARVTSMMEGVTDA